MSWLFTGANNKRLTGSYPGGHKQFRFNYPVDGYEIKDECSGLFHWGLVASKIKNNILAELDCSCSFINAPADWTVDTDLVFRVLHPDNPDKNLAGRCTRQYSKQNITHYYFFHEVSEDFWKDGFLSVEVEIGIKSMSENILKAFEDSMEVVIFDVGGQKFLTTKSILKDKSPLLYRLFLELKKQRFCFAMGMPEDDPAAFQVFMDIINGISPTLELKQIGNLLKLAAAYKVADVKKECEKYLMEMTEDLGEVIKVAEKWNLVNVVNHHKDNLTDVSKELETSTVE